MQPKLTAVGKSIPLTFRASPPAPETPFLGLAPYLRMNIAGVNLTPVSQETLAGARANPNDANLWMNLSTVMMCMGQRDTGLAIQGLTLKAQRVYRIAAATQPAKLRLLVIMAPGDISTNTPIDCLLEESDVDLIFYYVTPGSPLAVPVPEHDLAMVAVCECDEHTDLLKALDKALADWPKPVINAPRNIPSTGRNAASTLLQNVPGLRIPPTLRASRETLQSIAENEASLPATFESCEFPVILRPVGSHAGRDLEKISNGADIAAYLARVKGNEFYISRFIDYSGHDNLFRKYRIALIDGAAYACHMAVSSDWMVHYVNAGMYEDAGKRAEEAYFMAHFDDFARRHRVALDAISRRTGLDYVCIDCAETRDGELLIFEIDNCMVVHAMDPAHLFPFKQTTMRKAGVAFREFLSRLDSGAGRGAARKLAA